MSEGRGEEARCVASGYYLVDYSFDTTGIVLHELSHDEEREKAQGGFCGFHNPLTLSPEQRARIRAAIFTDFSDFKLRIAPTPLSLPVVTEEFLWGSLRMRLVPCAEWHKTAIKPTTQLSSRKERSK